MTNRFNPIQNAFVAGELSPRLEGRSDLPIYFQALRQAFNIIILPHGGAMRRSGTRFVAEVKFNDKKVRLVPFKFSTEEVYVVEFGDLYARFYTNQGRLEVASVPVEVVTPYLETQVAALQYAQDADVLYVVHPNFQSHKLTRTSLTSFTFTKTAFKGGKAPLRTENLDSSITISSSGTSGTVTLTASSPIFEVANDVGRVVRKDVGYVLLTSVSSTTVAVGTVETTITATATSDWALGLFSDTEGSQAVTFHEGRLGYGGAFNEPDRYALSVSDDFDNFELFDPAATDAENADKSISKRLTSDGVNRIQWMRSVDEVLVIGTSNAEFIVRGANDDILTPTGTVSKLTTERGSAPIKPVLVGNDVLHVQRNKRKLRAFAFRFTSDNFSSDEVSLFSEHILDGGALQLEYQQDPDSVLWVPVGDGEVVGFTLERRQEVVGPSRHRLGGRFGDRASVVESATVIPNPAETEDQVWFAVKRTINGATKRYIEFMEDQFRPRISPRSPLEKRIRALDDAFFVDSGLSLDNPIAITGITNANPAVVTTVSPHGLANGQEVRIRDVEGVRVVSTDPFPDQDLVTVSFVNNKSFTVANVTASTFELSGLDTTAATPFFSGGAAYLKVTTISGLDHLEGENVQVLTDGDVHPDKVVSSGQITLDRAASLVHVGLGFKSWGETERFIGGGRVGTDEGQERRIQRLVIRVNDTVGLQVGTGPLPATLENVLFRSGSDQMDETPPLFSGDKEVPIPGGYSKDPTIFFLQDQPLPMTVLAAMPRMDVGER